MSDVKHKANCLLRTRVSDGKTSVTVEIKPGEEVTEEALKDMGMSTDEARNFIAEQVDIGRIKEVGGDGDKAAGKAEQAAKEAAAEKAAKEAAAKKAEETNKGGGQQGAKK